MTKFSDGFESTLVEHLFRGAASPAQSTYHVSLATSDYTDAYDTGAEVSTANWSNYARVPIAGSTSEFNAPTTDTGGSHTVANSSAIDFGSVSLTTNSTGVTITHVGLHYEASSTAAGDKLVMFSTLANTVTLTSGDAAEFSAGSLTPGVK